MALYEISDDSLSILPLTEYYNVKVTIDESISTTFVQANGWTVRHSTSAPSAHWKLSLQFAADLYGFEQNRSDSGIRIIMDGERLSSQSDMFYGFSVKDQYFVFAHDFDGSVWNGVDKYGILIYPASNASLATGNISTLISGFGSSGAELRTSLANGDANNWHQLTVDSFNGNNWPVIFTVINNDIDKTVTFTFSSATQNLECTFNSSFGIMDDFNMYLLPDTNADYESVRIESFIVQS